MVRLESLVLLHAASALGLACPAPTYPSSLGTFENPSARCRPRFRYWLPDAGVDKETVAANIRDSGARGAGGVEFVPFYNYGGETVEPSPQADWVTNGFGTPAFRNMFRAALQAHKDAGLFMDFALGPNQGQGVPASSDDEGLQWDLVPYSVEVASNKAFTGQIPGWGTGELIAVVTAQVLSQTNVSLPEIDSPFLSAQDSYLSLVLDHESLTDITDQVSENGRVSVTLPHSTDGVSHRLFAYYQKRTLHQNLHFTNNATETIWDNGSYAVDHYSARGAQTIIEFWEKHMLTNGIRELLIEVGNYGASVINDYRSVLEGCYREYLQTLTDWARKELHLEFSAQVSYNLPMDMEVNIPIVDAPECESLQFGDNVDAYRQFSGPAVLAGKNVISNEMGATRAAYGYPFPTLLYSVGHAIAGGVNQLVLHGQSYTGDYYETTWPGYTAFSYTTSELYSDKQPSWDHGMSDVLNFLGRVQYTQQQGVPRVDLAIYNKVSATNSSAFPSIYQSDDLADEGWSWAYLTPDNFALPEATVKNSVLGPDGPRFKALIVTSDSNMTLVGVRKIRQYATRGLPIILSGGLPGVYFSSLNGSEPATIEVELKNLSTLDNVYTVEAGGVADKLASFGLSPNINVQTNGRWYTTWREDPSTGVDYALIFCDTNSSSGYITVSGPSKNKAPFYLNAWTGAISPVFTYNVTDSGLTVPVSLQGNQMMIIAFSSRSIDKSGTPKFHAVETPSSVLGTSYTQKNGWVAHLSKGESQVTAGRIRLSNGRHFQLPQQGKIADTFNLSDWKLIAEHWEAPENSSEARTIARKYNTTHNLPGLVSWAEVPALRNVSGLGYYTTTFEWPPANQTGISGEADGAYIIFPRVLHAIRVSINGHQLPPLDYTDARADISRYLNNSKNEILAVVPTTMWNYIRSILPDIRDQGHLPGLLDMGLPVPDISDNGLVGEVGVVPYVNVTIA
ncbi:hypothetical protein BJY01DRAFT_263735 [Aspergillus pseudoustus]|uniref:Secreted protein n=1 Tax=Aspergillus pseudoustus TaxID=1810923 RepID=A0ABR4JYD9_9EURO